MFDRLDDLLIRYEELMNELNEPQVVNDQARFQKLMKEQSDLQPIVDAYKEYKSCQQTVEDSLSMLGEESDEEMREMLKEELSEAKNRIQELEQESGFYEKQDILNAEILTEQTIGGAELDMRTWLASDENILVTEVTASGGNAVELQAETWASNTQSNIRPVTAENDGGSVTVTRATQNSHTEDAEDRGFHLRRPACSPGTEQE